MSSSDLQTINSDCIIIGGGITGLIIATVLQRKGIKVTILDKKKAIGGRLATLSMSQEQSIGIFDYGIQYFTVSNPQFQVWVNDWLQHGVIKEWCSGLAEAEDKSCYCGIDGMNGIAKYLAKNLDICTNTEVIDFSYEKKWSIQTKEGQQYQADMLIMTSPVPQTLSLLDASFIPLPLEVRFSLEQIEYDSCITVLALLEQPSNIPAPGCISIQDKSLAWLADNHQKGISPDGYAVTLRATPKFSDYYWDSDDAEIVYKLVTAAADYLDSPLVKYQVYRWTYSSPKTFYNESCLGLLELPLVMAGDAFVAPNLEGAVTSGMAAAQLICQRYNV